MNAPPSAALESDHEFFRALYERYADPIERYATRLLGSPHDAEEVAQDVFLQGWCALDRLRESPAPWLYVVARNLAIDRRRRDSRCDLTPPDSQCIECVQVAAAPDAFDADVLQPLVDGLPLRQHQILLLRYGLGLRSCDVGRVLGCSAAAVRQNEHRALERIRGRVGGRASGPLGAPA